MDSQLHDLRFWHDSQQMAPINRLYLIWLPNPQRNNDVDSPRNHHYKIRMVSLALYKPFKKHEQGIHTHTLILSQKYLKLSSSDLSFGGACPDHPSEHLFV